VELIPDRDIYKYNVSLDLCPLCRAVACPVSVQLRPARPRRLVVCPTVNLRVWSSVQL